MQNTSGRLLLKQKKLHLVVHGQSLWAIKMLSILLVHRKFKIANRKFLSPSYILISIYKGGSRTAAPSKMEHFVIIVNGWKPLAIITKSSILDVAAVLNPSVTCSSKNANELALSSLAIVAVFSFQELL